MKQLDKDIQSRDMNDSTENPNETTDAWPWSDIIGLVLKNFISRRPKDVPNMGVKELAVRGALLFGVVLVLANIFGAFQDSRASGGMFFLLLLAIVYFVPTVVATARNHPQRKAIIALNVLLGWTFLGWVGALVWSFMEQRGQDA